ncbi:hypothetical protein HL653_20960 [Sphingomonas sp. AP4-R1]|uniref:hypothetical protein n=1 Tax=Sphingomonas sp. AP4-R1 TaxID=2735134 RepID=UPI00149329DE|nr:hypothetical protein [Sphingomonas sp. AP4-R1]QJU59883.1 hypothetical protein HL653_20960 [Sphingomonas sp. AP4-R1]
MAVWEAAMMVAAAASPDVQDHAVRTALLDAARAPVAQALGKPVLFKVRQLRAAGRWAFLLADMEERDGKPLSYAGTSRAEAATHGMVSRAYAALLRRDGESWRVIDSAIGPTDVAWATWPADHGAPDALFVP